MSDSDLDEDELLQIALKEQAQRDVNYKRPQAKGSKPVVNLIRPPQPPPSMGHKKRNPTSNSDHRAKQAPLQRKPSRPADEDDESDVEMLSISSGDEDTSKEQQAGPDRGRAGSDGRASKDYADLDEDGEPRSWKRVDEAELARRVRDMREMRTSPGSQGLEQKPAAARKGLTSLQSLPRGVEVLDPLGLGVIDNKSLRLITASSISSPVSRERSESLDPSIREKVIYSSPHFDPKIFLSRVHQETSAADLEAGALTLKSDLKGRTQQKKQLVKENFDCFVSCKTTIDDIESKMRQIEEDPEGTGTARLYEATQRITKIANRAFQPLFERQLQAEKIRSVQGMLQRFRTLFNLPSTIRASIAKGEYDLAVREYRKAKSIVLPSHVGILKRVLEEVEKVMQEFRGMFYETMEDPELDLAELENIVRLLLELEPSSDPVWHYLKIQNRRVQSLLEKCTLNHEAQMQILHKKIQERAKSDAKWRQLQEDSNKLLDSESSLDDSIEVDSGPVGDEMDVLRGRYIHMLTDVVIHHVPTFWRLSLSVFSGKFAKVTSGSGLLDSDANTKPLSSKNVDKSGETKYSTHTLDEVAAMLHGSISAFNAKVQNTFRDFSESNILRPYMSDAIKEIVKACQVLEGKESGPSSAVEALHALHFEISKIYILRLCSWMRAMNKEISDDEMWTPLTTLERNKSPYAISYLPLAFQAMTISSMDHIDIMIQSLRIETINYRHISEHVQEVQESVRLAFLNSFLDFAGYLEQIGIELSQQKLSKKPMQNGYLNSIEKESSALYGVVTASDFQKRLLIVLSNIGYCKDELSHGLYNRYKHIWLQYRDKDEQIADMRDLTTSFSALEEKILGQYTCAKSELIRDAAQIYLLSSGIQWGGAPIVKGIRDATINLLHILVGVHAEVFNGAKPLLERILRILVEGLVDTFISLFSELKNKDLKVLDTNGFCQLMLELDYFETILDTYFSTEALEALKTLQGLLLEKACESAVEPPENPGHHRKLTRGSEEAIADDRQSTVSPDDLLALAQQYSSELLEGELERTRLNIVCFMESSPPPTSLGGTPKAPAAAAAAALSSPRGPPITPPTYRKQQVLAAPPNSRQRRSK